MDQDLDFPLLKNGLDFIHSAISSLAGNPRESNVKYAILHLCSGFELLFKERLRREHWILLFDKIDNADKQNYDAGNFTSANYDSCISRLEKICSIRFKEKNKVYFKKLRDKRNKIEHFGLVESKDAAILDVIEGLGIITNFIREELGEDNFNLDERHLLRKIKQKLGSLEAYVIERMRIIKPDIDANADNIIQCPVCMQQALFVHGSSLDCWFCHSSPDPLASGGYIENMNAAFWAVAQGERIVPYIREILSRHANAKPTIPAFPSNTIWALSQIGGEEALKVLSDNQKIYKHDWIEYGIAAISLRSEHGSNSFAVMISERRLMSEPSRESATLRGLSEGEKIQVLRKSIINSSEMGGRGGPAVFDEIVHISSGDVGFVLRAGDNLPPFI